MSVSTLQDVRRAAFHLLARREHSTAELIRKLRSKAFDLTLVQTVVAALTHEGLLSDARFAESFVHYRRGMGYGPVRIKMELKERGLTDALIEQALALPKATWLADARHVWRKRFKNKPPTDYKSRAQHMRFLQYRGFTHEQIQTLFAVDDNTESLP